MFLRFPLWIRTAQMSFQWKTAHLEVIFSSLDSSHSLVVQRTLAPGCLARSYTQNNFTLDSRVPGLLLCFQFTCIGRPSASDRPKQTAILHVVTLLSCLKMSLGVVQYGAHNDISQQPSDFKKKQNTGFFSCKIVTLSPPSFGKSTKLDKDYPFVSYPLTQLLNTVPGVSGGSGREGARKTSGGGEGLEGRNRGKSICGTGTKFCTGS